MSISPIEQRLAKVETDILHIKTMLGELLDNTKAANQDQPEERIMSAKDVAGFLKLDLNVVYAKCAINRYLILKWASCISLRSRRY